MKTIKHRPIMKCTCNERFARDPRTSRLYVVPGICPKPRRTRFYCRGCRRFVPWCCGAADDMPDRCDACWSLAHTEAA